MKIFVVGARGFPDVQGGIETHCEELYIRIAKKGVDITALTIKKYTRYRWWNGIKFISIPTIQYKNVQKAIYNLLSALYCVIRKPDLVHIHGLNAGLFIWLYKLASIKVIATYHSMDYIYPKWNILMKFILRFSEKQFLIADYIIVVSKLYLEHFRRLGVKKNIIYLPNGMKKFQKSGESKEILKKWSINEREYILSVGRITPEKDYMTLIRAFFKANLSNIKLVIAGGYEFRDNYAKKLIKIANNNVIFTGYLQKKELQALYENCCLFVLPSICEGLPIALLEAISFNCNILVSDIPAHKQLELDPGDYFKACDENDLADKIITKIMQKNKNKSYNFILKDYNWDIIADKVNEIYNKIYKIKYI